jgi:hypothetical protein
MLWTRMLWTRTLTVVERCGSRSRMAVANISSVKVSPLFRLGRAGFRDLQRERLLLLREAGIGRSNLHLRQLWAAVPENPDLPHSLASVFQCAEARLPPVTFRGHDGRAWPQLTIHRLHQSQVPTCGRQPVYPPRGDVSIGSIT